ncbi:MAG TPA: hypothetical protein GX688_04260 [Clostridiales bacterium]|jgi:hypothetical protein|nr:hypothetical protein [Clostridiales bacterium]
MDRDHSNNQIKTASELEQIDCVMRSSSAPAAPELTDRYVEHIRVSAHQRKRALQRKRFGAAAAVLVIAFSSMLSNEALFVQKSLDNTDVSDSVYCLESLKDPFARALQDPDFHNDIMAADRGHGYNLIEQIAEDDGSYTFVVYFYPNDEPSALECAPAGGACDSNGPLSQYVRSFTWIESE